MSFRGKLWVLGISGVIAAYAVIGGSPFLGGLLTTSAQQPTSNSTEQLRIVESVLQHIQNDYVDEPNMDKVRIGALRGLAGGLDQAADLRNGRSMALRQRRLIGLAAIAGAETGAFRIGASVMEAHVLRIGQTRRARGAAIDARCFH